MEQTVTKFQNSTALQNFSIVGQSIGWELTPEDGIWWAKVMFAGITDFLNIVKHKSSPKVCVIQDLKGNRLAFACVEWINAEEENEAATGNWTYYWSFDCNEIPESAEVYTIDQEKVQSVISNRAYDLVKMVIISPSFISQLCVFMINVIKDTLDQQAVEEGHCWTLELDGYFEASVEVVNGEKQFSILPKGEMKTLIKDDSANEK